ncbi:MAG: hypothetical protein CMJ58_07300 [Planctomycetaceae bacterium]|nr:hypothetical protein [Planctomycetaceae bacterium]
MSDIPPARPVAATFENEFLPVRAKLLEVAAALDRLDRGAGELDEAAAARRALLVDAVQLLAQSCDATHTDRAERLQLLFSRAYDADWRQAFEV